MTNGNGSDRLDRVERILEELAVSQRQFQEQVAMSQRQFQDSQRQFQEQVANSHREFAARQQYHDEAFERHDAEMKSIRDAIAVDAENIRALARIAELHHERLNGLEGDEPA